MATAIDAHCHLRMMADRLKCSPEATLSVCRQRHWSPEICSISWVVSNFMRLPGSLEQSTNPHHTWADASGDQGCIHLWHPSQDRDAGDSMASAGAQDPGARVCCRGSIACGYIWYFLIFLQRGRGNEWVCVSVWRAWSWDVGIVQYEYCGTAEKLEFG